MVEPSRFILDNNVISSFHAVDWLNGVECWTPGRSLLAPSRVWVEFQDYWDAKQPEWLDIREVDLEDTEVQAPGVISPTDWACVILTESIEEGCLVTNDIAMHSTAERRGVDYQWGTQFLLSTFYRCGISEEELGEGISSYSSDLGLSTGIVSELEDAEK